MRTTYEGWPRHLGAAFGIVALSCMIAPAGPARADTTKSATLSLPQAQATALQALKSGDATLAARLARALVQANPENSGPYFILAQAHRQLGDRYLARRAAALAFRYAKTPEDRFTAAQIAAKLAYDDKRFTASQYWLRRSLDPAPNARLKQQAIRDFKRVRAENPWSAHLTFSVSPSDNVNSGAQSPYNLIEGLPVVGLLSPGAQALSGVVARADVDAAYRIAQSATSQTRLTFRATTQQVSLSSSAKAAAPGLSGSDFSSVYASFGLTHAWKAGENGYAQAGVSLGRSWYGGAPYYDFARADLSRSFALGPQGRLSLAAGYEHRDFATNTPVSQLAQLRFNYQHSFASGDALQTGLSLGRTFSDAINNDNRSATAYITYQPARKIGPARLSLTLGASRTTYDAYSVGFLAVPGGREDDSRFAAAALHFDDFSYAGFAPTLTLQTRATTSNVSRFDTQETTLSISLKSNF
ncbi:surface lipoprotein assembly modifier [Rhodalgimonas zhirmunskyi]|uniref:Surface lipoprotein assembly modifier n=1 Tax=Rhodalgimonas zhirmunskyi TaxID=2964767 RepID=A0AAJ1U5B8_9RHOB|nr:surface lipoprotein assembly modifier [Rhodoalgimonas zhirmunskyi]MDQ2093425.1 surface lipoprotein assembly modifier [Rhodoalgimonas zhirmunskyi]